MNTTHVTPLYAALFGLLFVLLSVRTISLRRRFRVAIGHGDQSQLERASRVHANFAEYVPLALLLVFFLELDGPARIWIHTLCLALLIGRILHAFGVSQVRENRLFRVAGMALTFLVIVSTSVWLLAASMP